MSRSQIALLKKYGLEIRGFRGQHVLIDPNVQKKIVALVAPRPGEWILEIGPGLGALTGELLASGASVLAVENDRRFCEILEGELGGDDPRRLYIENTDVLKTPLDQLLKRARRFTRRRINSKLPSKLKVVSNLPYYITSPVLFWLIGNRAHVEQATLMMQKEVSDRLLAQPGERDYGRLTLALRYYADTRRAFEVSRNCFTPRPEVDSSVVVIDFHPASKFPKGLDENFMFHLIQTAFSSRRKTLLNQLSRDSKIGKTRGALSGILEKLGLPEKIRGEELLLKDFITLALSLQVPLRGSSLTTKNLAC
ncbi:MAG: ribosomal RNA small subunit methyltransferase A [Candidatus Omnitrophica bacterium]|nr:ribosomal RNA small subunit methyltransferase A [Candidatus Omnitrophota bacterium]